MTARSTLAFAAPFAFTIFTALAGCSAAPGTDDSRSASEAEPLTSGGTLCLHAALSGTTCDVVNLSESAFVGCLHGLGCGNTTIWLGADSYDKTSLCPTTTTTWAADGTTVTLSDVLDAYWDFSPVYADTFTGSDVCHPPAGTGKVWVSWDPNCPSCTLQQ